MPLGLGPPIIRGELLSKEVRNNIVVSFWDSKVNGIQWTFVVALVVSMVQVIYEMLIFNS